MKVILGTMTINYTYVSTNNSLEETQSLIQKYIDQVDDPILDTAYYYGNTKTEQTLGKIIPYLSKTPKIATKANPWFENDFTNNKLGQLSKDNLERQLNTSLNNLNIDKVDIFYLHCPDYETPIKDTLEGLQDLYRKDKFDHFGISNFSKDQLNEVLTICQDTGIVMPKYYQGMYNVLCRKVEEVFPILKENNINFWGYNPLAGGLLTGKYINLGENNLTNSRFKDNKIYQNIFYKPQILNAINEINDDCDNLLEYSLNWYNNTKLDENDAIIIGASNENQLDTNIKILSNNYNFNYNKGNQLYNNIINYTPNYFY
jgi:aflatoxin B1 aldehyde reductase